MHLTMQSWPGFWLLWVLQPLQYCVTNPLFFIKQLLFAKEVTTVF